MGYCIAMYTIASYATGGLGLSQTQAAALQSLLAVGFLVGRPLTGILLDVGGRIDVAILLNLAAGVSCWALWMPARSFTLLAVFALVQGSRPPIFPAMNALLDAVRARSPCALHLVRAYSTSIVQRVESANFPEMRRLVDDLADSYSEGGDGRNNRGRHERGQSTRQGGGGGSIGRGPMRNMHGSDRDTKFSRSGPQAGDVRKFKLFGALVENRFDRVLERLGKWSATNREMLALGLHSQGDVERQARLFRGAIDQCVRLALSKNLVSKADNRLFWSLRRAFVREDTSGLDKELRFAFQSFIFRPSLTPAVNNLQENIADFRFPYEWYPATRTMQRTIHLHVGPTNSGKTYRALLALENAKSGIYAGPLRLLAHEIYARFLAKGRPCALITGEEQRFPTADGTPVDPLNPGSPLSGDGAQRMADSYFQSCTVEMTPLNRRVDVAVIDEIQMIADPERGWAWTQAFLGVQAAEVHLCGEERSIDLIQALCARIGDKCVVHKYQRLSALQTMNESLRGDFSNLRKGDAVVSFSRVVLHSLKAGIEQATGRRCAIVYGSLPPETRAQQAALFNDPDNDYDFLVASDAIGMGLNLEVKRVIFETSTKHDGVTFRHLNVPEVKQIGGRAGRFRTAAAAIKSDSTGDAQGGGAGPSSSQAESSAPIPDAKTRWGTPGFVTTLDDEDLPIVQTAFQSEAPPLEAAGIQPPVFAVEQFARYFPPETPFSFILTRMRELAKVSGLFQMCSPKESIDICNVIEPYRMTIYDRCIFISSPTSLRDPGQREVLGAYARCVSEMRGGALLDIPEVNLEILDVERAEDFEGGPSKYLVQLEALHKAITLYLWLSYRYVGVFSSQQLAFHVKALVEKKIDEYLNQLTFVPEAQQRRAKTARYLAERRERQQEKSKFLVDGMDEATAGGAEAEAGRASAIAR
ncbi:RNA helicase [Sporothrix curviconia]|uniref:RNA helicase n=1 Tax=Sporothrix curviconia TaxID=1260050 RepID=A0ABP0C7S2_9PEZI